MQEWQAEHEPRGNLELDLAPPRGPIAAVRRFFANRSGARRAAEGHDGWAGEPALEAPEVPTCTLAAPPPPPTSAAALLDTRVAREVRCLLGSLGTTRGAVAAALDSVGVRAAPGDPEDAPIARFLSAVVGADPNVKTVRVREGAVVCELRAWWRPTVTVALPPVVEDFTLAFDAGCYPTLLRDEHRPGGVDCNGGEGGRRE